MRFAWLACVVLSAPLVAQELDVNGYSKVVVPRAQGGLVNTNALLRAALRDAGLEVHGSVAEIPRESWSSTLYMTAEFDTYHFFVVGFDVATQTRIAYCALAVGAVRGRGKRQAGVQGLDVFASFALQNIIRDLGYQGFDQGAHDANVRVLNLAAAARSSSTASASDKPRMSCRRDGMDVEAAAEGDERAPRRSRRRAEEPAAPP